MKLLISEMRNFGNLITKDVEFEIPTNEEPREEGSPRNVETQTESSSLIVEKQPELKISKRLRKAMDLRPNKIDNQFISFI